MTGYANTSASDALWNKSYQIKEQGVHALETRHAFDISLMTTKVAADYEDVLTIGVGEFVIAVFANVITASTTSASTVNVGDSASATQYLSGVVATTTGFTWSAATAWKYYSAANALRVTLGTTAPQNGIVSVGKISITVPSFTNA